MTALERPGVAHRIYSIYGMLNVIEDHASHGTCTFRSFDVADVLLLVRKGIDLLRPIVSDGYFALASEGAERLFSSRFEAAADPGQREYLECWSQDFLECVTHLSRIMRIGEMPAVSDSFESEDRVLENEKSTLMSFVQGNLISDGYPLEITVQQSNACNLRCRHCYQSVDQEFPIEVFGVGLVSHFAQPKLMSAIGRLSLAGRGEPTLSPSTAMILATAKGNSRCDKLIFTNGTLAKALKKIAPALTHINLSFDGGSAETFELIRSGADFEKVIHTVEELLPEDRAKIEFNVVVNRLNVHEASEIVRLAHRLGMKKVRFSPLVVHEYTPWLNQLQFSKSDREDYKNSMQLARETAKDLGIGIVFGCFDDIVTVSELNAEPINVVRMKLADIKPAAYKKPTLDPYKRLENLVSSNALPEALETLLKSCDSLIDYEPDRPQQLVQEGDVVPLPTCGWPWTNAYINADGSVVPCCGPMHATPMGNLRESTFDEIWNGTAYQRLRRQLTSGENYFDGCAKCDRGIRFMHLQKACRMILENQEMFSEKKFVSQIKVPSHIMALGVVKKVLEE